MKLALGTAQFGLPYGITNKNGLLEQDEVNKILRYAHNNDILTLDTACSYGDAEQKIGNTNAELSQFQIVTKITANTSYDEIEEKFFQSLKNLQLKKIYGLLLHSSKDLLNDESDKVWQILERLKAQGYVGKIGVSVYHEEEIRLVITKYKIDIIQLPINVFDQRLLKSNILQTIKSKGIEIHARSIFLQGILLENLDNLPTYFLPLKEEILKWHDYLKDNVMSRLDGALAFVNSLDIIDYAVIGITSLNNLIEVKAAFDKIKSHPNFKYEKFAINNEQLINPNLWPR